MLKVCSTCRRSLPAGMFWRNVKRPDGLQNQCRECCSASNAASRMASRPLATFTNSRTINLLLDSLGGRQLDRRELKRLSGMKEDSFGLALATCLSLNKVGFRATEGGVIFYRR